MTAKLWWIISKDLVSECRSRRVWPAMLLLGIVVALTFAGQMDLPATERRRVAGGMLWLAIFFAGMLALDRSFASEREDGCWEGLRLYPFSTGTLYLAKLAVNIVAMAALQCVLIPLFVVLSDVPLLAHPAAAVLVALLGNLALSAVGTLLSALGAGIRQSAYLLPLLVLPMAVPAVLAAAEATRLAAEGDFGPDWWRWIQLLAAFAVLFITLGMVLFDFVLED
ncbi:MAG: heme exporter protein CcmB [Thermoguttaceae bacterium]|jgi:heme exporter protein B